ncbi:MAG TPA: SRPBCC family protein [Gemmatimonadaceae bacterium]|nr:SRPBCC family protein [Gemmatimonadaceae bacterium]
MMASTSSTDRIEKQIVLDATQSRVWRAISDYREFNSWFGVALQSPFTPGGKTSGNITITGYDHMTMDVWVEKIEPEHFFSFRWHPNATDANVDYSKDPTTLVTFSLEAVSGGTKLTIVESGFDALPEWRRAAALKGNDSGWASQTKRIADFIRANP